MSQQQSEEDVGAVVAKAKRAASSLWMIIHAQVSKLCLDHDLDQIEAGLYSLGGLNKSESPSSTALLRCT